MGALALTCDVTDAVVVATLFDDAAWHFGRAPDIVGYNTSRRVRGPTTDVDAGVFAEAVAVMRLGAFHVAQRAARRMLPSGADRRCFVVAPARSCP